MGTTIFRESAAVERELPSGYSWRLERYADDEGIVITVTLVASNYKPGTWKDKFFSRKILNASCEVELEAETEEIEKKIEKMKNSLFALFFNRA
jgi:hypothetical protein